MLRPRESKAPSTLRSQTIITHGRDRTPDGLCTHIFNGVDDTLVDKVNVRRVDAEEYVPTAKPNEIGTVKIVPDMFTEHHARRRAP